MKREISEIKPIWYLICAVCGLLTALPVNYGEFAIVDWLSIFPLVYVLLKNSDCKNHRLRRAYTLALTFFSGYYLGIYYFFVYMYPLEFTGLSKLGAIGVILAGWLLLGFFQSSVFSLLGIAFTVIKSRLKDGILRVITVLLFPSLWVIFEWLQTLTWAGVPFARIAVGQQKFLPAIQSASLLGSLFVGFLIAFVNSAIAYAFYYANKRRLFAVMAASVFAANLLFGVVLLKYELPHSGEPVKCAVIQGNVSSIDKWSTMKYSVIKERYLELCRDAADDGAEILVIPESSLPSVFNKNPGKLAEFCEFAREYSVTLLLGGFYEDMNGTEYNAIYCINPDGSVGQTPYLKRKPVPFGEYVPMRKLFMTLIPPLAEINMLEDDMGGGSDSNLHDTVYGKIGSLICFDSIYDFLARESTSDGAEILTVSTNDSWFSDSPALMEHFGHSVLRAVENGRYLLRAANTGISGIISPKGEVIEKTEANEATYAVAEVYRKNGSTIYSKVGNIIVPISFIIVAFPAVAGIIKKKQSENC